MVSEVGTRIGADDATLPLAGATSTSGAGTAVADVVTGDIDAERAPRATTAKVANPKREAKIPDVRRFGNLMPDA